MDPERVHRIAVAGSSLAAGVPLVHRLVGARPARDPILRSDVAGIPFENPVGLAAGWDKNGTAVRFLARLGFGAVEIGSISSRPSVGNPSPRLFRLPEDQAIVVNYGLPNDGAEKIRRRLGSTRVGCPLGINLVKTNDGPDVNGSDVNGPDVAADCDSVLEDYATSVGLLQGHADYLVLNLSCPNAAGGGDFFSEHGNIDRLLQRLASVEIHCPLFLKVAPDPSASAIDSLIGQSESYPFVRGVLFNLPRGKPSSLELTTPKSVLEKMPGAVAGKPVQALIDNCIGEFYRRMPKGRYVIIGGGGVFSAADAYRKIRLGASLVQIYTALIYEGPGVIQDINEGLASLLRADGFKCVTEAVGVDSQ